MLALLAATFLQGAANVKSIHVPDGFVVDRPSALEGSLLSLAFGGVDNAFVGRESQGIARLRGRDGRFETIEEFAPEIIGSQGLAVFDGALYATGSRDGQCGVWRVPLAKDGSRAGESGRVFEITDCGEHGVHALVAAGKELYLVAGNQAALPDAKTHLQGYWRGDEGRLLPPMPDPLGFGTSVRYPGGFVARIDPVNRSWQYVAVGLRNAYDLVIDEARDAMYTVDSDMEWDLGLPWYRPVRALKLVEGADYGSRAGSGVLPAWCVDTHPALIDLGRGSPTGIVLGEDLRFPEKWKREWIFYGDWSRGKIVAATSYGAHEFLSADEALPITDLAVGPERGLWFLTGGRGARGGVYRVTHPPVEVRPRPGDPAFPWLASEARELIEQGPVASEGLIDTLRAGDVYSWGSSLRVRMLWQLGTPETLESLMSSESTPRRAYALLALAKVEHVDGRAESIARLGAQLLEDLKDDDFPGRKLTLAILRGLELGLLRQGDPSPELGTRLTTRLLAMFPHRDDRVSGEIAVLLSHLDDERALGPLLAEMQKSPQELAIHYCDCAHRMTHGWDLERRKAMLAWFARSREYKGGISLPGYLSAMRAHFVESLPAEACLELAPQEGLDAQSLALLFARLPAERTAELFPRYEALLAQLVPAKLGAPEQIAKDAALRALEKLKLPEVEALARKLAREQGDVLEAPWMLLARTPDERDFSLWLGALVSTSAPQRDAAFRALSSLAARPKTAGEWRTLLDQAGEIGARRGRELMRTLLRWTSSPDAELLEPAAFDAALAATEKWYASQFPGGPPPTDPEARPRWSEAQILAFLERAKPRPGSPSHGRAVFESASCGTCHALGKSPATDGRGFGPDLANVAGRLSTADLLAAIVAPSRAVSDQYRTFVARTTDERLFEGLVLRRDARGVALQPVGAAAVEIDADELESLEPSKRSAMPEGLLEARTLEEIRDLFAFLETPDATAAANPWSPLLGPGGAKGWNGDSAVWSLRATTILGRSSGLSRSSYLLAAMPAQDLCVEFDVFLPPGGNSGLCYRAERPSDPAQSDPSGLQADLGQSYWGSLYSADGKTLAAPEPHALEAALDRNGWNHVLVRFQGEQHAMEINGFETYSAHAPSPAGTQFGFQVHQGKPMLVRIANARWRAP